MDTINDFRKRVSSILNCVEQLKQSAETTLAKRMLQRSFSWMGLMQKAIGSKSPYADTADPSNKEIVKVIPDFAYGEFTTGWGLLEDNEVTKVKFLRNAIQACVDEFENGILSKPFATLLPGEDIDNKQGKFLIASGQTFVSLLDAKMWLGWHLDVIGNKDEAGK